MNKICRSCKIEKESSNFYQRKINSDGLYSYCKECAKKQNKEICDRNKEVYKKKHYEYREKNREILNEKSKKYYYKNREKVLKKSKEYRHKNKKNISMKESLKRISDIDRFEKNRKRHYEWSVNNRERLNQWQRDWYQKNKEKRRAHVVLHRAIKKGIIVRSSVCEKCNEQCKADGHHENYSKPLQVVWLCRKCHSRKSPRTVVR